MLTWRKLLLVLLALAAGLSACRQQVQTPIPVKDPNYKKAKAFLYKQNDSAFYYFNKVATTAMDSLQTAFAYNYMGRIQSEAGDYFGSQESLSMSLKYLDTANEKHRQCLAANYNELGLTSISLKNYTAAIGYFNRVGFFNDKEDQWILFNNKALAYQEKGEYNSAINIYKNIIGQTKQPRTYARILTNMATTKWLADPRYQPLPDFRKALAIRVREKDSWGLNSSYLHLADYYAAYQTDSAIFYANRLYAIARELASPDDELQALEKLIRLGSPLRVKPYFTRYHQLNDSLQTTRNAAKNQFAFIRYEVEKNKADKLTLQQENTAKQNQILKQWVVIYFALSVIVVLIWWYRKRRQLQEVEKQNAIQEHRLKTSKRVHDALANDMYRIMKKIQNEPLLDRDWLVDNIDDVYERARDISYDIVKDQEENYHGKLSERLTSFSTDETRVVLVGNGEEFWNKVNAAQKFELKYILQELMVNMKKHSRATDVVLKFEIENNQRLISYLDNGIGLPPNAPHKNGLTNTGNRINSIGGTITFDSSEGKGLKIQLSFPVA